MSILNKRLTEIERDILYMKLMIYFYQILYITLILSSTIKIMTEQITYLDIIIFLIAGFSLLIPILIKKDINYVIEKQLNKKFIPNTNTENNI